MIFKAHLHLRSFAHFILLQCFIKPFMCDDIYFQSLQLFVICFLRLRRKFIHLRMHKALGDLSWKTNANHILRFPNNCQMTIRDHISRLCPARLKCTAPKTAINSKGKLSFHHVQAQRISQELHTRNQKWSKRQKQSKITIEPKDLSSK